MTEDGLASFDFMLTYPTVKGDLNGDGIVNALDIQLEINACVADSKETVYDLNEDGIVNALDIQTLINIAAYSTNDEE